MVKEIHAMVDGSIDYLLNQIKTNQINDYLGTFTESQFSGLVGKYKMKYPQNPFITEKQIKDLCLKYDLKFGSMLSFVDEVPIKNQLEIKWFEGPGHDVFNINEFDGKMNMNHIMEEMMGGRTRMDIQIHHGGYDNDSMILRMSGGLRGFMPHKFMLPITKNMAIHMDYHKVETIKEEPMVSSGCGMVSMGSYQRRVGGMSLVLQDSEFNMILISIPNDLVSIMQSGERGRGGMFVNIECEMAIDHIMDIAKDQMKHGEYQTSMKVIAPGEFFNTTSLKEVDGYRFSLDELAMEGSFPFMDDPIVLEPVDGGYLVVTKWGGESNLINTDSN